MKKEDQKFQSSTLMEGMTSISAILSADPKFNDRKIEKILVDETKKREKSAQIGFLNAKSHELGFPVEFVPPETIQNLAVGNSHGGILALCTDRKIPLLSAETLILSGFYVYLDGIEDPYNFGNALRSLYAAGVDGVVLPLRNWMTAAGVVARSSAGASEKMPLFAVKEEADLIRIFKEKNYPIYCAGIRDSVSVFEEDIKLPLLLVIGGEKRGISRTLLNEADKILRIDYGREFQGSLSTAASAAVLAFEIYRKNRS